MDKDVSDDSKRALALSKRDQVIESFKGTKEQLMRIDQEGPKDQEDVDMIKMCVKFVVGEICFSNAEQARLEKIGG
jgi:hypothetical protein